MVSSKQLFLIPLLCSVQGQNLRAAPNASTDRFLERNQRIEKDGDLSKVKVESYYGDRKPISAVVHVGPMKTGSTSIQTMAGRIQSTLLEEDGYENAPICTDDSWRANFVRCMFRDDNDEDPYPLPTTRDFSCHETLLPAVEEVATMRGHNLLLSSEFLSRPDVDVNKLKDFLEPWDDVYVIAYYRRFYDYIVSLLNEYVKYYPVPDRTPIDEFLDFVFHHSDPNSTTVKPALEIMRDSLQTVRRYRQFFKNVHVENMNDMLDDNAVVAFFCNAMPDAPNSCEKVKEITRKEKASKTENHSRDLIYENLAYYAKEMNLWKESESKTLSDVAQLVQERQENELKRTKYEFDFKTCADQEVLDWILDYSLESEKELFPEYYKNGGEEEIRKDIAEYSTTKFCNIDAKAVVENDQGWQDFFKSL